MNVFFLFHFCFWLWCCCGTSISDLVPESKSSCPYFFMLKADSMCLMSNIFSATASTSSHLLFLVNKTMTVARNMEIPCSARKIWNGISILHATIDSEKNVGPPMAFIFSVHSAWNLPRSFEKGTRKWDSTLLPKEHVTNALNRARRSGFVGRAFDDTTRRNRPAGKSLGCGGCLRIVDIYVPLCERSHPRPCTTTFHAVSSSHERCAAKKCRIALRYQQQAANFIRMRFKTYFIDEPSITSWYMVSSPKK